MKALSFFVYANFWVSLCVLALTYQSFCQLGLQTDSRYIGFVFFSTLLLYNFQRLFFSKKYFTASKSSRHQWIVKNKKLLIGICLISVVFVLYFFLSLKRDEKIALILIGLLSLSYFMPGLNLRRIPGLKASFLAGMWTIVTLVFPLWMYRQEMDLALIGERFLFMLPLCIIFNVRDIAFDRDSGIRTLPVLIGIQKTKSICLLLLLFFCILVLRNGIDAESSALCLSALITGWMIQGVRMDSKEMYYAFFLEGTIALHSALFLLAWNLT